MPFADLPPVAAGTLASLAAGAATALGAFPAVLLRGISARIESLMLGFAAGVMLAAAFFSLILPGLDAARARGAGDVGAVGIVGSAVLVGAAAIWLIHRYAPHEHFVSGREGPDAHSLRRIWLFVIAITLHNLPEGLAVGVAFAADEASGRAVAIGIGLQNVPEGLAVALALAAVGYGRFAALAIAGATGLVEPVGGFLGASAMTVSMALLPFGLAFAAGAMLFVISEEVMPETHRRGLQMHGTAGLMVGFVVMMALDVVFA